MKTTRKLLIRNQVQLLLAVLLMANVSAFVVAKKYFSSQASQQKVALENKQSYFVSGLQVLNWGFSLMDYFDSLSDKKN